VTCQQCRERPAHYHLTSVVEGQTVQELHLCERCAAERGVVAAVPPGPEAPFSLQGWLASLLAGLGEGAPQPGAPAADAPPRCPRCGHSYLEFSRTGLLGCPECYVAFGTQLEPVIRRVQGTSRHEGKVPARAGGGILRRRELAGLRSDLDAAVAAQAFERAAELRDRIRDLEAAGGPPDARAASPEGGGAHVG